MLKKILLGLFGFITVALMLAYVTGNSFLITSVQRTYLAGEVTANINDHKVFSTRQIDAGSAQIWLKHEQYNTAPLSDSLTDHLERNNAIAYVVIKDG